MYKEGIKWLISERPCCLGRKTGEWCSFFWFCFVDFGVGVVCLCVYFPEHLRVILHSYSSRREGLRKKKSFLATKLIRHPIVAAVTAPVAQPHRAAPLLHRCAPAIPLTHRNVERRTGMQSRGICVIFHCPTSLAVCKTNAVTCFGVAVSLQPFLYLIKKLLEKSLWVQYWAYIRCW